MKLTNTLFTLTLLGVMAGIGSASTITFTTNIPSNTSPFSTNFALQGFNTAQGTLTGINIAMTVTGIPNLQVVNTTGVAENFTNGNSTTPVTVTGPDATTVSLTETATGISGSVGAGVGPFSFAGPTFSGSNNVNVAAANFSHYEGTGTFNETFTAASGNGTYSGTAPNGVFFSGNATAAETVTITYTFSSAVGAPEPAAMVLLGLGLAGLGLIGRKKRLSA